jgi:hypothetical protein
MKSTFINIQTRIACRSNQGSAEQNIHAEIAETIAERNKKISRLENIPDTGGETDLYPNKKAAG